MPSLAQFVTEHGGLRKAAHALQIAPSTLSGLTNQTTKASPATARKLQAHGIPLDGLVEHCPECQSVLNGCYCERCGVLIKPRGRARGLQTPVSFYRGLLQTMLDNRDDPVTIEGIATEARKRGVNVDDLLTGR